MDVPLPVEYELPYTTVDIWKQVADFVTHEFR